MLRVHRILFEQVVNLVFLMDEHEFVSLLNAFITSQRQLLLMSNLLNNDMKRITHIPHDIRHKIRQLAYVRMINASDLVCHQSTRMDRRWFVILCHLLRTIGGLTSTEVVDVEEMVAMFIHILAHDVKNRVIQREFMQSGETIFCHFHIVLLAIIRLHDEFLKKPQPVANDCTDQRWRWFEVHICLELHASTPTTFDLVNNHHICVAELPRCIRWDVHKSQLRSRK
ncbi:hypothetical protein IC582_028797 [Cucumis melo]